MPIEEAEKSYQFKHIDKSSQEFWEDQAVFSKVNRLRKNGPQYSFLDGPPYCSGKIHLGTAWNKTIKDTFLRFKSMNGYSLRRQAGWDMHGLPIEHKVEELMDIKSKQEIESNIGISNFVDKCQEFAFNNKLAMTKQFESLGVWMDWEDPYMTLDPNYMQSAWWTLKRAQEKNLLTNDKRVISWCPHCETALAAAELDYEERIDPSIYIQFKFKNSILSEAENPDNLDEYILVWTTTPWTIPANLAICINPSFDYDFILIDGKIYVLASELVENVFGPEITIKKNKIPKDGSDGEEFEIVKEEIVNYQILKTIKGEDLLGREYIYPLLDQVPIHEEFDKIDNVHTILAGEHVELSEGTGCVHTAPGHGPDDFNIGKEFDLPIFCPVDEGGNFTSEAGIYKGLYTKDADEKIIGDLIGKGFMLKHETIEHRYGVCWRCKSPILYRATEQWFLKVTDIKDKMLSEIENVEWVPKWAGEGRFHDWVSNAQDWTISRQRYWGIPIPIWICPDCGEIKVIGSVDELKENSIYEIKDVELSKLVHRPFVDEVKFKCEKCNGEMTRIPDVLDVWIDSGVAGWAALYYPQEIDKFNKWYPYDFICEGHDQTRGWFYSQLGAGVISLDRIPYNKVLMHGFVLDENGKKMSKSLGNVVSPEEVIEQYGADVLRFYLLWACKPWDDLKFVWDELKNVNKMFNILWNVYVFSTTYMSLDNFNPLKCNENSINLRDEDRWIISRVNTLTKEVGEDIESLHFHKATRKIMDFILDDLSRWYVRLIRGRTWVESDDPDKLGAYYGLYTALTSLIKLMAPITPHLSEEIYQNLVVNILPDSKLSVHMEDWIINDDLIDVDLEKQMNIVRDVIDASIRARDVARYKLRWPVADMTVVSTDEDVLNAVNALEDVIKDQSNTKEVIPSSEFDELSYIAKPNLKILGKKLKGDLIVVKNYLENADGNEVKNTLDENGEISITGPDRQGNEKTICLSSDEIIFDSELPEDFVSSEFKGGNVFVNTKITPLILSEAMSRELIRRIQDMRKDMDLDVEANIKVSVISSETFKDLVLKQIDLISNEVRANSLTVDVGLVEDNEVESNDINSKYTKNWKIDEENIKIEILKD